jgi:adenylate cyclase
MARLVLQTADGQQVVELGPHNSLGRHPSNTIQLLDKIVSKEHCIIERRGNHYVLRDLGSLNGTFINRDRVNGERGLNNGDEIALGQTKARFEDAQGAASYPPPSAQQPPQQWQQQPQQPQQWQQQPGAPSMPHPVPSSTQQQQAYQRQMAPPSAAIPSSAAAGGVPSTQAHGQGYPPAPGGYQRPAQPPQPGAEPHRIPAPNAPPGRTASRAAFATAFLPRMTKSTEVDADEQDRQIGAEIAAVEKDFRPFDEVSNNVAQLRADYERLRLSYELTRDIADEKDTEALLEKILQSIFRFIRAQRGVIFLVDDKGELAPCASHRDDGGTGAISVSTTILNKVVEDRKAVLTHDAAMDFAASKGKSMILNQIQSAIVAPMLHNDDLFGVLWLDSKSLAQFQAKDLELVTAVANQAAMFIEINMLGKQVQEELINRERLSRLLSPNVAERVIKGQVDVQPGGARTLCTVFNSDIRGFTRMSEDTPPEQIVEMLNSYFEEMVDTIFKYEGTLDKFMGDGIMALWGAPVSHPDDAERAVACAIAQIDVLGRFNRARTAQNKPPLGVGFGVHTGPLVAGYIGSSKALSYTVIGDVANTSARLCSTARAGQVIVSDATIEKLGPRFEYEELQPAKIKGKTKPMKRWNVLRARPLEQVPDQIGDHATDDSAAASAKPGAAPAVSRT